MGRCTSFYFQAKMDEHLVQSRKEAGFMWALWNKQLELTLGKLRWTTRLIKLAHCVIMKKNPHCTDFGNVAMHNGLGNTHKALCVSLPTITSHHG